MVDLRKLLEKLVKECRSVQQHGSNSFNAILKEAEAALAAPATPEEQGQRQPGPWTEWDGTYEKQAYDVWVAGCDVVLGCWPGDGAMFATDGSGRSWKPGEALAVRVSAHQGRFPSPFKKVLVRFDAGHGMTGISQETLDEPRDAPLPKASVGQYPFGRRAARSGK